MNATSQKLLFSVYLLMSQVQLMGYTEEDIKNAPKRLPQGYESIHQLPKIEERLLDLESGIVGSPTTPTNIQGSTTNITSSAGAITISSTGGNINLVADQQLNLASENDLELISNENVTIFADQNTDNNGYLNILSGTSTGATSTPGDIAIVANNDVLITGNTADFTGSTNADFTGVNVIGLVGGSATSVYNGLGDASVESENHDIKLIADADSSATGSDATGDYGKVVVTAGSASFTGLSKGDVAIGANNDIDIKAMNNATVESIDQDVKIIADADGNASGSDGKVIITAGNVSPSGPSKGSVTVGAESEIDILAMNNATVESVDQDVRIIADTDDSATGSDATGAYGKVIITGGGVNFTGLSKGDVAIGAKNDIEVLAMNIATIESVDQDIRIVADADGSASGSDGTGDFGKVIMTAGNVNFSGLSKGSVAIGAESDTTIESLNGDIKISADTDGSSTGKINIKSGTTTPAAIAAGDIGLSASGDIILESDNKNISIQADTDGMATGTDGSIKITAGNVTATPTAMNEIQIIADNDICINSINGIVKIEGFAVNDETIVVNTSATGGIMGSDAAGGSNNPGGDIKVFSGKGDGTGAGGDVIIKAETSTGSGDDGNVRILTGGLSFAPSLSDGDIGLKSSGKIVAESSSSISLETIQPTGATNGEDINLTASDGGTTSGNGGDINLTAGSGTGGGTDGDINLIGKDQNINLISLILHILKAARIQPQTNFGSICFSNINNDGKSRATYDGIPFTLTMDSDAGTLTITAPGAVSAPSPSVVRLGDGATSMTTTTGINMVSIQWLANGRIEVTSTT